MQNWFILTLISLGFLFVAETSYKNNITAKQNITADSLNFFSGIIGLFFAIIYLIIFRIPLTLNLDLFNILLLLLVGLVYYESNKLFYSSYKGNSISISYTLLSLSSVVAVILGIIFYGESITLNKVLGITSILTALFIVNYKRKERFSRYNLLALLGAFIFGVSITLGKHFSTMLNPHLYQLISIVLFLITTIIFSTKKLKVDLPKVNFAVFKIIIISGLAFSVYNMLIFMAYSLGGEAGKIEAILNTITFIMIGYEVIFLKDCSNLKLKIIGAIFAVIGILLLSQTL